jgi:glutathione S-transferase
MGEVFIWRLFNQVAINPAVWGTPTDDAVVKRTLEVEIPDVLDYLETQLPAEGFCFREISIADVAIACFFRNAAFARHLVDASRWPATAAFVDRVLALESFAKLAAFEERLMRTPIARHRSVLAEMGAPVTSESFGTSVARRGVMRI